MSRGKPLLHLKSKQVKLRTVPYKTVSLEVNVSLEILLDRHVTIGTGSKTQSHSMFFVFQRY